MDNQDTLNYLYKLRTKYNKKVKYKKELLSKLLRNGIVDNNPRSLKVKNLKDRNVISVFESSLTRMLKMETNTLTEDIIVVKVFYFEILKDLILNGFTLNGEKYRYFTSSAGQIRTKKTVFIKESLWYQYEKTLMCGLTLDVINQKGGINVNKYLAYLALTNSATDEWNNFDIKKSIVVPDFETKVNGEVDLIDDAKFTIERKFMDIPVTHTDGCGMILPSLSSKNFMVRLPWVKGLLGVFDFRKFIIDNNVSPIINDIYGNKHNILDEDIQIIFTESQFKMYKYYDDWEQYQDYFIKYNCTAGKCSVEEDRIPNAKINYQMLQTLTAIRPEEINRITRNSTEKLHNITSNVKTMLDIFGATKYNDNKTDLQKCLMTYPELLNDVYIKQTITQIKKSLVKNYKGGKLEIAGKFTFLIPDLYAFCEKLFLGIENPDGLLKDKEVYCRLYEKCNKLDCLRSPHLYKEHAIRNNIVTEEIKKWFQTDAIYTSCHDLISKILQFDDQQCRALWKHKEIKLGEPINIGCQLNV